MAGRKLKTFDDFRRSLKNKYGVGQGKSYKPWLRVQDVKSKGVRSQISGLKTERTHHTLSSLETELFYLVEFADSVVDIREQFPLFPINLSIKISEALGVEHPVHPETKVPIIITTDFLLTRLINGVTVFEAISVKSEDESNDPRVLEKIEIERIWWELLGIKFSYYTGSELTKIQSGNINWATHPIRSVEGIVFTEAEMNVALSVLSKGQHFIRDLCNLFISELDLQHEEALNMLRCLIAKKKIEVDLSYPLENSDVIEILNINIALRSLVSGNY